jgi:outer membrane protein assembly factor BamA
MVRLVYRFFSINRPPGSVTLWLVCALFILPLSVFAQSPDSTLKKFKHFSSNLTDPRREAKAINRTFQFATDSLKFVGVRNEAATRMSALGYAEFSLDSSRRSGDSLALVFHRGPVYRHRTLRLDGLPEPMYNKQSFDKLSRKGALFDPQALELKLAACLDEYQDRGYPFARFDSLRIYLEKKDADVMLTDLRYRFQPGSLVTIDTIIFEGKHRENERFLQTLAGIHVGDVFDQSLINNLPRTFNNSIYFKNTKIIKVQFVNDKAIINVSTEPKRAGRFDLLLGLLPPRQGDTKLQFTGLVDIQLVSPFLRAGELVQLRFDKLIGASQKLNLKYQQPYLFGSPMNVAFEFNMLKQDTLFLNRWLRFTGGYAISPQLSVQVWYKNKNSSIIDTSPFENDSLSVPPVLDSKDQLWGAGFVFENLDYRFNPSKGFLVKADIGLGGKKITRNPRLHPNIYENLDLKQPKKEAELEIQYYFSPFKRFVVMLGNRTWWLDQDQFFQNDLLQVGGSRSIRGFNENEFYTNFYTFFTAETRLIIERNSWLFVFADYAYLENQIDVVKMQRPLGIGAGMVYETKAGMVSLTYAVGRTDQIPFQPSRGRIHIGLINQF